MSFMNLLRTGRRYVIGIALILLLTPACSVVKPQRIPVRPYPRMRVVRPSIVVGHDGKEYKVIKGKDYDNLLLNMLDLQQYIDELLSTGVIEIVK